MGNPGAWPVRYEEGKLAVLSPTIDHQDNLAWYRQLAAGWARRLLTGGSPGAWANNTDAEITFAITHLRLNPGARLLDLACGWGRHSLPLAAFGARVTGLDLSHELLVLARYHARRQGLAIQWVEGDIDHLPLRGEFDAIAQFCGNLLTWCPTRDEALHVLWNVSNRLRPGGRLLIGTNDWEPDLPQRSQQWDEWQNGAAIHRQKYDRQRRMTEAQMVVFGPQHQRREYWRQTWWPSRGDMEKMFSEVGLRVCGRHNTFGEAVYDAAARGLIYVLARE